MPGDYTILLEELASTLEQVIDTVVANEPRFTVTREGKPIAALVPSADLEMLEAVEDAADLQLLRELMAEDDGERISLSEILADIEEPREDLPREARGVRNQCETGES